MAIAPARLGHCLPGFEELPGDSPRNLRLCRQVLGSARLGAHHQRGKAKRWAAKCRIDGEWLETDFISAYCHMRRINVTVAMLGWRVVESGRREPYLVKQLLIGAPDRPRYSHGLLAYVNRNHYNAATIR